MIWLREKRIRNDLRVSSKSITGYTQLTRGALLAAFVSQTTQVICRDRGRPARNERKARKCTGFYCRMTARLRRVCGRDAQGPSKSLEWQILLTPLLLAINVDAGLCGAQRTPRIQEF